MKHVADYCTWNPGYSGRDLFHRQSRAMPQHHHPPTAWRPLLRILPSRLLLPHGDLMTIIVSTTKLLFYMLSNPRLVIHNARWVCRTLRAHQKEQDSHSWNHSHVCPSIGIVASSIGRGKFSVHPASSTHEQVHNAGWWTYRLPCHVAWYLHDLISCFPPQYYLSQYQLSRHTTQGCLEMELSCPAISYLRRRASTIPAGRR